MTLHAQQYDAMLLVHFGTTHDDTRAKTIDTINDMARQLYPNLKVCDCLSSTFVIKRLASKGIMKPTPTDALLKLRAEGCRRILVQPTYIINGIKMDMLRQEVEQLMPFFDEIKLGTPLLTSVDDCRHVSDILVARHAADAKRGEHVLFVGHGTEGPATAIYAQLDYMLRTARHHNYHVATIEGYPTLETAIEQLILQKCRQVTLVPLLFVVGDHAKNDIATQWKAALEEKGIKVRVIMEGLGEIPEIQRLFIESL